MRILVIEDDDAVRSALRRAQLLGGGTQRILKMLDSRVAHSSSCPGRSGTLAARSSPGSHVPLLILHVAVLCPLVPGAVGLTQLW